MSKSHEQHISSAGGGPRFLGGDKVPIKAWVDGVPVEQPALQQLHNISRLPFVHHHVAAMPDVHFGIGATVGSVIPFHKAIVPAAVGVDIGCGMIAWRTSLTAARLPDSLRLVRSDIEAAVPHGRSHNGDPRRDAGAWREPPPQSLAAWAEETPDGSLAARHAELGKRHAVLQGGSTLAHLGSLGGGNHFIELCLDEADRLWVMLHSGSRGIGNRIGTHFIALAKREMERWHVDLPDPDLAFLPEGTELFDDYLRAMRWAQDFAAANRRVMMQLVIAVLRRHFPDLETEAEAINCHHNYVQAERHFGKDVWLTRKGAVRAGAGELGIIPGSMGARSYIVRGKGNADSFCSCSHGAGRAMSRTEARRRFSLAEHAAATAHVECRKDDSVLDETPMAYKDIDAVMAAQADLVDVVHTLRQVICVKG